MIFDRFQCISCEKLEINYFLNCISFGHASNWLVEGMFSVRWRVRWLVDGISWPEFSSKQISGSMMLFTSVQIVRDTKNSITSIACSLAVSQSMISFWFCPLNRTKKYFWPLRWPHPITWSIANENEKQKTKNKIFR